MTTTVLHRHGPLLPHHLGPWQMWFWIGFGVAVLVLSLLWLIEMGGLQVG